MHKVSLFTVLIFGTFLNLFSQSQDQNYIKTTEYLESVLIESDFTSSFGGWLQNGSVNYSLENGRLKANVNAPWEGVKHPLNGFVTKTGDILKVKIVFDKGNTLSNVRLYLQEIDTGGNLVSYNLKDDNLQTGIHEYNHTIVNSGNSITVRVDKDNTNTSTETYFYIDYISLKLDGTNSAVKKLENVTYFDGFGKVKQQIAVKQSANKKDIVQHIEFDQFGRTSKQYLALPTTQNTGNYIADVKSQIVTYYDTNFSDQHPFSEVRYDNSPLNRKLESASPGNTWELIDNSDADHTAKYEYGVNHQNEVFRFDIDDVNPTNPLVQSYYPEEALLKNIVKNQNWTTTDGLLNTKEVFIDKNGRKIAEFSYEDDAGTTKKLSTYYVYDDVGNLRYVLPPKLFVEQGANNYEASWPLNDFLLEATSESGLLKLEINNNALRVYIDPNGTLGISSKKLHPQVIKSLSTSPMLPDLYIGVIRGAIAWNPFGGWIMGDLGFAEIINGELVITRTSDISAFFITMDVTKGVLGINQTQLNHLAFQYKYDQFNRQIEQKVPGKDWEYMVYDQLDRPILTQDANLKTENKWLFNKYDVFGRVVYTGKYTNTATRAALQTQVDNFINASTNKANSETRTATSSNIGAVTINYSNTAFPNTNLETLTVNYFDDYNFTDSSKPNTPTRILEQDVTTRTKGLLTATWTKTLGIATWSKNYTFYDKKGRVIYIHNKNHLDGYTENESQLDFRGKILVSHTKHKRLASNDPLLISDKFYYDHAERPIQHKQLINETFDLVIDKTDLVFPDPVLSSRDDTATNSITLVPGFLATATNSLTYSAKIFNQENPNAELIAENTYNELGQLKTKNVGGTDSNSLQTIDYTYNIRGWLTNINDVNNLGADLFAYTLKYDEATEGSASVSNIYNGNIKQVIWKSAHNSIKKSYAFEYDKLNRFSRSFYRENSTLTGNAGQFETSNINYDANGNIEKLQRWSTSTIPIDDLNYYYDAGNKLLKITDGNPSFMSEGFKNGTNSGDDYDYDTNGNLIKDLNKNITNIEYNHLDLVKRVTFSNGNTIEFLYEANGSKLQMKNIVATGGTTTVDYLGGFQYTNTALQFFPTPEGYVAHNSGVYSYVYQYKDHLGNNRVSFSDTDNNKAIDTATEILSNTDYYVMGLTHSGEYLAGVASNYNYKYQNKEQLAFGGYNMYDFGSRMYDASVGRWFNTDPQNQFGSPYLAMANNWPFSIDPNGEIVPFIIWGAAALIGGTINVVANWDRIDNVWEGLGHFATGAGTGVASVTLGPAGYIAASTLAGGLDEAIQGGDMAQIIRGSVQSGFGSAIGLGVGQYVGKFGGVLFNKLNVTSPLIKGTIGGSVGGALGGGLTGGLFSAAEGGNFGDGFLQGAKTGAIYGGIGGAGQSVANSYAYNLNPITGKPIGIDHTNITKKGINNIKKHLSRPELDYGLENDVMIRRLELIRSGEIKATKIDLNFYAHELRESYLMNFSGYNYDDAHQKALNDYGIEYKKHFYNQLYIPDAIKAGNAYYKWEATGIID